MVYYIGTCGNNTNAINNYNMFRIMVAELTLRVDGGGEYIGDEFIEYLLTNGIFLEVTAAYSSSQNGIAERRN